jgi:glutaconate CoA-transferase subunit B
MMAVAMARCLRDGEVVFHGVSSILPMLAIHVARRTHAPRLVHLNIGGGVGTEPGVLPKSSSDPALVRGTAAIVDNVDFYQFVMRGGIDATFLGFVQMDPAGRTNSSVIGDAAKPTVRLPGGGGAAVILPTARRVILYRTRHTPQVFVAKLDFVTATGNVDRVVTPLGVLVRREGRLHLEQVFPYARADEIRRNTGFALPDGPGPSVAPPPSPAELAAIGALDPGRVRDLEFG